MTFFFCFKQKTAYEMRISDWSSDVCSSDLQRRKELTKVAGQYAEQARVAIRGVRRDGMDGLKKLEKDGEIGEDDAKMWHDEIQNLTDASIKKVDEALAQKTKRSEEHTSDLQSLIRIPYAVFYLIKKITNIIQ